MYPNIQIKSGIDCIHPFIEPLVMKLAEKHPDWTFVSHHTFRDTINNVTRAAGFIVRLTATEEELGQIGIGRRKARDGSGREDIFEVYNRRIQEGRERGHCFSTNKVKDAIKAIHKAFYPKTLDETLAEAYDHAEFIARQTFNHEESVYERTLHNLREHMYKYIGARWDEFVAMLPAADQKLIQAAANIKEVEERRDKLHHLWDDLGNQKMLTVFFANGKYTVGQGSDAVIHDSDTLPMDIRQQIGMLKLVPEKEVIPDVGLRVGNTYFIMRPNQGA
jgi:hypothetical protein